VTGEKNRYKTVENLWKLDDNTLKTPKHDEMILWLLNPENIKKAIPEYQKILNADYTLKFNWSLSANSEILDDIINGKSWEESEFKKSEEESYKRRYSYMYDDIEEYLQGAHSQFINMEKVYNHLKNNKKSLNLKIESEIPIKINYNQFIVGYWDIKITLEKETVSTDYGESYPEINQDLKEFAKDYDVIYIEVKPYIDSFGATLRQLRTYQSHVKDSIGSTYLFTFDEKFKEAFESQGIKVIIPSDIVDSQKKLV